MAIEFLEIERYIEDGGNLIMLDFVKNISATELLILVLIVFLLFGAKAMVGFGKTSGETVRELKKVKKEITNAFDDNSKS